MRVAKTLIRLGGCPGWSESSLGAQSFCWFCHAAAQMLDKCSDFSHPMTSGSSHLSWSVRLQTMVASSSSHLSWSVRLQEKVTNGYQLNPLRLPNTRKDAALGLCVAWERERSSWCFWMRNLFLFPLGVRWVGYDLWLWHSLNFSFNFWMRFSVVYPAYCNIFLFFFFFFVYVFLLLFYRSFINVQAFWREMADR